MSLRIRKIVWLVLGVAILGTLVFAFRSRPPVVFRVTSLDRRPGSPVARCEIQNRGDRQIEVWVHSLTGTPCYHHLQRQTGTRFPAMRDALILGDVLTFVRTVVATPWQPVLWDDCCGIDLDEKLLAPGQRLTFSSSNIQVGSPTRLTFGYRRDGTNYTFTTGTILP